MKFSTGFWFRDWYENVTEAAKYGFRGFENLTWTHLDLDDAAEHLKRNNVTNSTLLIESRDPGIGKFLEWEHGMVYEDSREPFLKAFRETVEACVKLGTPNICATCGNERFDIGRERQIDMVVSLLSEMGHIARESGLTVVFEPLNVIVDHMGIIIPDGHGESFYYSATMKAHRLKQIAKGTGVPILMQAQLNRAGMQRWKKPSVCPPVWLQPFGFTLYRFQS